MQTNVKDMKQHHIKSKNVMNTIIVHKDLRLIPVIRLIDN